MTASPTGEKKMKIYYVLGMCGEYSDRREWTVAAYKDEAKAQAHAKAAKEWVEKNVDIENRWDHEYKNPFDPFMSLNYDGADWTVCWVELLSKLPTKKTPMKE